MKPCAKCQNQIDPDAVIPYYSDAPEWSKVGPFYLCDVCIDEILSTWFYTHLNQDGELING